MDIRVGDMQWIELNINGANLDKTTRVSVRGVNGDLELYWDYTEVSVSYYSVDTKDHKKGDGKLFFKLDEDKAWALTPGVPLELTVKVNYMQDTDGDGKCADTQEFADAVANMLTLTTASYRCNVLPSPFKRGDVNE